MNEEENPIENIQDGTPPVPRRKLPRKLSRRTTVLLLIGVVCVSMLAEVLTGVLFPSPERAVKSAFAATAAELAKQNTLLRAEIPLLRYAAVEKAATKTNFELSLGRLEGDISPSTRAILKLLAGANLRGSTVSDPESQVSELDVALAIGSTELVNVYAFVSPWLIAGGLPSFSDALLAIEPQNFAVDAMDSPLYDMLGLDEEQLYQVQEALDARFGADDGAGGFDDDALRRGLTDILVRALTHARYERIDADSAALAAQAEGAKYYRVSIPEQDARAALLELVNYVYLDSQLANLWRAVYSIAPASGQSYEKFIRERAIDPLQETCPDLILQLDMAVNGIVSDARLTVTPANAGSISAPFEVLTVDYAQQNGGQSVRIDYEARLTGVPTVITCELDSAFLDGVYDRNISFYATADRFLSAGFTSTLTMDTDGGCGLTLAVDYLNGNQDRQLAVAAEGTAREIGSGIALDFPKLKLGLNDARLGSYTATLAYKAGTTPITSPYGMDRATVPLFLLDEAALDAELKKYQLGIYRMVKSLLGLPF